MRVKMASTPATVRAAVIRARRGSTRTHNTSDAKSAAAGSIPGRARGDALTVMLASTLAAARRAAMTVTPASTPALDSSHAAGSAKLDSFPSAASQGARTAQKGNTYRLLGRAPVTPVRRTQYRLREANWSPNAVAILATPAPLSKYDQAVLPAKKESSNLREGLHCVQIVPPGGIKTRLVNGCASRANRGKTLVAAETKAIAGHVALVDFAREVQLASTCPTAASMQRACQLDATLRSLSGSIRVTAKNCFCLV
jgi:hypothetical protein